MPRSSLRIPDSPTYLLQEKYRLKAGTSSYRECEHCGERVYGAIYKLIDVSNNDTIFVDEACVRKLT